MVEVETIRREIVFAVSAGFAGLEGGEKALKVAPDQASLFGLFPDFRRVACHMPSL
jgi:hypothetical protein